MHIVVGLMREGYRVGTIDLDVQQGTLTRYVDNRRQFASRRNMDLPHPLHQTITQSDRPDIASKLAEERVRFKTALAVLDTKCDVVVIDTPGGETRLSVVGHSYADTLVTPLNDSFIDLDVLARIDPDTYAVQRASRYSAMVWEIRKERSRRDQGTIDWVVLRNRLAHLNANNKRAMGDVLGTLAARLGFRLAPGMSERVIFRELFPTGLTLLDLHDEDAGSKLSVSQIAARRELRELIELIGFAKKDAAPAARTAKSPFFTAARGTETPVH
jgi:chromosome partitioning protein